MEGLGFFMGDKDLEYFRLDRRGNFGMILLLELGDDLWGWKLI